jgi:hypothetical protein
VYAIEALPTVMVSLFEQSIVNMIDAFSWPEKRCHSLRDGESRDGL